MTNYTTAAGVQHFSITIASSSTTGTVNLGTAVGTGAFITYGGFNPAATTDFANAGVYLTWVTTGGTTTITATRNTSVANTVVVTGSITDGDTRNLIKAVQSGTVSISAGISGTASVTAPSSDGNTAIHYLGNSGTGTTLVADTDYTRLSQSGGTVTANVPTSGTTTTGFCLVEFQSACLTANAVQRIAATSSSNVTSWTASLAHNVVLANTISLWGGRTIATVTTNDAESLFYGSLTGVGTFTINVNTGVADAKNYNASIIEFNSGVLNSSVQRGTLTLTGVASNTATLTPINITYSGLSWLGNTTTASTALLNESTGSSALSESSSTTVTLSPGSCTYCVNGAQFANNGSTPSLLNISSANPITSTTAGSLLVVALQDSSEDTLGVSAIVDNQGQSWSQVPSAVAKVTGHCNVDMWYFANTVAGVTSITLTQTGSFNPFQVVYEIANGATSSPVIASSSGSNLSSSGSNCVGRTFTITNGSIIIQQQANSINTGSSVSLPYTIDGITNLGVYWINAQPSNIVTVTKNSATANITGSWEVFEFPAYISITINSWYSNVYQAIPPLNIGYEFSTQSLPDEVLKLPIPWIARIVDAPPVIPPDKPNFFMHTPDEILNLLIPFLPRLPDVAPPIPPLPQALIASPIHTTIAATILSWFPWIANAVPLLLQDKPNYFAPRWLLNLPIQWISRSYDAPIMQQQDKASFFSPLFTTITATVLSWFPLIVSAPPATPSEKPSVFSPPWPLKFVLPWLSKVYDAPPIIFADKPIMFSPEWLLNFRLPWLPRVSDAAPITPADRQSVFSDVFPLNLSMAWLSKIFDAPTIPQADKPNYFAPLFKNLTAILSWMPRIENSPRVATVDRPNFFEPLFRIPITILSWFPRITHSEPPSILPPQSLTILPEPDVSFGVIGRLLRVGHRNRNLPVEFKSDIVTPEHKDETLELSQVNTSISTVHKNRTI